MTGPRTTPLKINLDSKVAERLDDLARKYTRRSGATVAAEVVIDYLDFWEEVEKERQALKERQREAVSGKARKRA